MRRGVESWRGKQFVWSSQSESRESHRSGTRRRGVRRAARPSAASLAEDGDADLVLVCVPDSAIATVAAGVPAGPVDRARERRDAARRARAARPPLQRASAADVHARARRRADRRRLGRGDRGNGRRARRGLDARTLARAPRRSISPTTGARSITRARRSRRTSSSRFIARRSAPLAAAGAPPEALLPLMRRTIDNGFDLTGPIARGDSRDRRRAPRRHSPRAARPRSVLPRARRGDASMKIVRTIAALRHGARRAPVGRRWSASCRRWARCTKGTWR